jgi:hypothetical protein
MANGKVEGNGGGNQGEPEDEDGVKGKSQRGSVIEHPVTLKVDNLAFFLPCFQTSRAEVFATPFNVAQSA